MSSDPGVTTSFQGREPNPPSWDGAEPSLQFAVYKKNVRLWEFESGVEEKKRGVRLLRSLTGVARAAADSLEFEEITSTKGVENILGCLEKHFAPHLEVSLPRAFERAIYGNPRSHKESIQEYLIRSEQAFHLLEKEGVKLPEQAVGYVMFRQAALTENQELRFGAWAQGKYDKGTVVSCLRKLDKVVLESKGKSSVAYMQEDDDASESMQFSGDYIENEAYVLDEGEAMEEQYVYLSEHDENRIYDESEVQMVLATYQEVRKAIQGRQKGRQYYNPQKGKGKERGSPWQDFVKDKKRIHIEQLKLRTRCAKCGNVGHWAKECKNSEDSRGKAWSAAAASSKGASSSPPSTSGGQSWYVSTDAASGATSSKDFCLVECRGKHTLLNTKGFGENFGVESNVCDSKDEREPDLLRAGKLVFDVCQGSNRATSLEQCGDRHCMFVGLTTNPMMGIVDTAAQDGLVGDAALKRLKGQLRARGLQEVWIDKVCKAHGVGGQAKVVGMAALPLGLAGCSGVLEVSVIEGDVPLLLPIKLLRGLQAVVDLSCDSMHLKSLGRSVELHSLPSGHVAVDVLDFGERGFSLPSEAREAGYTESDFRCHGSESGCVMLTHVQRPEKVAYHVARSPCSLPPRLQSSKCGLSAGGGAQSCAAQSQESSCALATDAGQGAHASIFDWARGLGKFMAASGIDGGSVFSAIARAAGRGNHRSRVPRASEVQSGAAEEGFGMHPPCGEAFNFAEPACGMDPVLGLQCPLEDFQGICRAEDQEGDDRKCNQGADRAFDAGEFRRDLQAGGRDPSPRACSNHVQRADRVLAECGRHESDRSASVANGTDECGEESPHHRDHDERVRGHGDGSSIHGKQGLSRQRDACLRSEAMGECDRGAGAGSSVGGVPGFSNEGSRQGQESKNQPDQLISEDEMEENAFPGEAQGTWMKLEGASMMERVASLRQTPHFAVSRVCVKDGANFYEIENDNDLEYEPECYVLFQQTARAVMEDTCPEEREVSMAKSLKTKLRKALKDVASACFSVDVSEIYSPPRVTTEAKRQHLKAGGAYDLKTGYNLRMTKDLQRMWSELHADDPELLLGSPPCTPFSPLQELNFPKMDFEKAVTLVGEGLEHVVTTCAAAKWQYKRGKIFVLEHPLRSKAWEEECMLELMGLPEVHVCVVDQCAYGLRVGEKLNKKPTCFITNSPHIAQELRRRCSGDHEHDHLLGGKAAAAAIYPPGLCKAIVRGLKRHLRHQRGPCQGVPCEALAVLATEVLPPQDADVLEDVFPEEIQEPRESQKEKPRAAVEVSNEDKAKVMKMHVNLGHLQETALSDSCERAGFVRKWCVGSSESFAARSALEEHFPKHRGQLWCLSATSLELQWGWTCFTYQI